jgi:hypothetical protein
VIKSLPNAEYQIRASLIKGAKVRNYLIQQIFFPEKEKNITTPLINALNDSFLPFSRAKLC